VEAGASQLGLKLAASVSALVMGEIIPGAPQSRMLWDRDDRPASRPDRPEHLSHGDLVLVYVLQDVECANHVEV